MFTSQVFLDNQIGSVLFCSLLHLLQLGYSIFERERFYEFEFNSLKFPFPKILTPFSVSVNLTSSPTLGPDGQVFIGGGDGEVIALKQKNGEEIWRKKIGSVVFISSPRLSKSGLLYIGTADKPGPVFALNHETGDVIWRTDTDGPIVGTALITKKYYARYF